MKQILIVIRNFLNDRFTLHDDKADENEIIESISKNVEFRGTNLWALIFAIFIASIGLNVNSTAVIIGAMLISPIMGPIMGIGLGVGINDIELIRKASKNLIIATIISICVSTFYFFVTPLHEAQSELLARTTPSIWDVFIAFFGGLAGIVAGTRREKSNVIPGVAIATALMPPLCTAGYGLASGNIYYFLGALYLFFINSVFICISTYLMVRYLRLPKKAFENKEREKKVSRYVLIIVIITALPSIYLAYRIVSRSIFETNANLFLHHEFKFKNTFIVNKAFKYDDGVKEIDLLLLGEDLSAAAIDSLKYKLPEYNIKDARLTIHQGLNAKQQIDFAQIKASILEDVVNEQSKRAQKDTVVKTPSALTLSIPGLKNELRALYPSLKAYSIAPSVIINCMDTTYKDTVMMFWGDFSKRLPEKEEQKFKAWLKSRLKADSIVFVISNARSR